MLHYTLKTLFRRKKELAVSVFALTLCVMLVTAAVGAGISVKTSISDYTDDRYGTFRAIEPTDAPEKAGLGIYGTIISENSIYNRQLSVGYVKSDALPIRIVSGRLPEKPGEAAVEESLAQAILADIKEGGKLSLDILTPEGETENVTFTVVGFTEDTSRLSVKDGRRYLIPSVVVAEGALESFPEIYSVTVGEDHGKDAFINPRYTDETIYYVSGSTTTLLSVTAALTVMAAAISVFVFSAAGKPAMDRHYSDLRFAGAGGRELAAFTVQRTLILSVFASVVGAAAGYGFLVLFSRAVLGHFLDGYTIHFPWGACVGVCVGIFAAMTLIGLMSIPSKIRHRPLESSVRRVRKRHPKASDGEESPAHLTGISYSIFGKWAGCFRKKRRAAGIGLVAAMCIAYVAVYVGAVFGTTINDEYNKTFKDDYSVRRIGEGFYTSFRIPEHPYYGMTEETLAAIAGTGETEYVSYTKALTVLVVAEHGRDDLKAFFGIDVMSDSNNSHMEFGALEKRFSLDPDVDYYLLTVIECDSRLFSMLEKESIGDYLSDGKGAVMLYRDSSACPYKTGDSVKIFQALPGASGADFGDDCRVINTDITLTGIAGSPIISYLNGKLGSIYTPVLVLSEGFFESLGYRFNATDVFIGLSDREKHEKTDAVLSSVMTSLPESVISSAVDQEAERAALLSAVSYSSTIAAVFLSVVCIAVFASVTRSDYLAERRVFGVLRSVGLDRGRMVKQHISYTLRIFGRSALINFVTVLILNILPLRSDIKGIPPVLIVSYFVFTICALAATLPTVFSLFRDKIAGMTGIEG